MTPVIDDLSLDGPAPLQQQLYRQLSQRILQQRYLPGRQLPSSRQLAADLGVSRNTVNAVYDQLKAEGFLRSQAGKGIFVHEDIEPHRLAFERGATSRPVGAGPGMLPSLPRPVGPFRRGDDDANLPFNPGLPDLDAFPIRSWNRLLHHQESRTQLLGYSDLQGYPPLRKAIAEYVRVSRGVRCHHDQVIVTQGAQQGLALIGDVFLRPGDRVLSEDPGYRGARYALGRQGHTLVPVPLRREVLDIDALGDIGPARLLYCTPTHQYPMGGILDISQRMALVQWAQQNQTWIIEDDYDSEFHFCNKPFAAIQGLFDQAPVLYVGSFSKTLLPALRVGYLVVPEPLVDHFVWAKRISGGESPLLSQAVIAEFIDSGQFTRHLRRMRQLYRDKWQYFQARVSETLAGQVTPVAESAGMHQVLEGSFNDGEVSRKLRQRGYGSAPLSDHFIGTARRQGLVMGFASASEREIDGCIAALAQLLPAG
ncbi:MocR-like pyridoxine biosynthesis transcription factor PdxR [Marinobacter mobilis]|uniref:GntR family transcriptional regulator / MocR family aminotransferase n=1 Tax=Marinobacter mobilis TaxID=488533 RepID=A0A1H3CG81_9GAMM|nr:PLP-dependent aminotransferase family protein [Marinobacter mobilis]SDW76047.1 transcriptional regulator, GntR family [Marinobacter mobilis]SDX53125.1 GntR family transcriptional regulator / MocR family aminotransferase [Marinobacter mobilis]